MGLFGDDDKKAAENAAMAAELARLQALSLIELAEEILLRAYGPGGPRAAGAAPEATSLEKLTAFFNPATSIFGIDKQVKGALEGVIAEGVQVLEHARLLVGRFSGGDYATLGFALTRAGSAALAGGDVPARIAATLTR
jgi:hypothetical protein